MNLYKNSYLIIIFSLIIPIKSYSLDFSKNYNYFWKNPHDIVKIDTKIGVVDFRSILKESKTMKKLGKEFLKFEKLLNAKIKKKQLYLENEQKNLLENKNKLSPQKYAEMKTMLKKKITDFQKSSLTEKKKLKSSFDVIKKKLEDILASTIKTISKNKNIDLIILKENIFLFNNIELDLTNEALLFFDDKTRNLKITSINKTM